MLLVELQPGAAGEDGNFFTGHGFEWHGAVSSSRWLADSGGNNSPTARFRPGRQCSGRPAGPVSANAAARRILRKIRRIGNISRSFRAGGAAPLASTAKAQQ